MTALFLAVLLSVSPSAHAEAERLAKQSITDYNVGDFKAALEEATRAYKLDPIPAILYNLGQVHRALHNWERAEFFYRGYLRGQPAAPNRAAVEKLIEEMEAKQAATAQPVSPPTTITVTPRPVAPVPPPPTQVPVVIENGPPVPPANSAPPPPAQQPRTILAAEPGANNQAEGAEPVTKSHTASFILGAVAIAAAGFAVAGYVEDAQYTTWANNTFPKGQPTNWTGGPPIRLEHRQHLDGLRLCAERDHGRRPDERDHRLVTHCVFDAGGESHGGELASRRSACWNQDMRKSIWVATALILLRGSGGLLPSYDGLRRRMRDRRDLPGRRLQADRQRLQRRLDLEWLNHHEHQLRLYLRLFRDHQQRRKLQRQQLRQQQLRQSLCRQQRPREQQLRHWLLDRQLLRQLLDRQLSEQLRQLVIG